MLTTDFGFVDGTGVPPSVKLPASLPTLSSGLPFWSTTSMGGLTRAGSANGRDGAARLSGLRDQASSRLSTWGYDDRGRLSEGLLGALATTASTTDETVTDADFRSARTAPTSVLSAAQHATLGSSAALALEPGSWTATQTTTSHQTKRRTLLLAGSSADVRDYTFDGARRTNDGIWKTTYDEFGRVTAMEQSAPASDPPPTLRRIEFTYDPNGRMVGRKALKSTTTGWVIEDRTDVLGADALPADATFVWDPLADHLVSVFVRGASTQSGATARSGLVRQNLYGDQGYDDLTESRVASAAGNVPTRYFPVTDHAGSGSLQAVVGAGGDVAERVLYGDSYGDAPRYLQGPVVDRMTFKATKTMSGDLQSVEIRVHLSEQVAASTLSSGVRLASIKSDRSTVAVFPAVPTLEDKNTILWSLTAGDWTSLTTTAADSIEIDVTSSLRADSWGNVPVQPPPTWKLQFDSGNDSTTSNPVIHRESIAQLTTLVASFASGSSAGDPRTLYEIANLYMVASPLSTTKLLTGFQMAPFMEPANGMAFFRHRWFDPTTGTWLTPDPIGYGDSSNLYAGLGGDPVNRRDPRGNSAMAIGFLGGLVVGSGVAISNEIGDCIINDECKDATHYLSQIAQFGIVGAEIGASLEHGGVGGGSLGFALGGAGFSSLGAANTGDWKQFANAQAIGAGTGLATWGVLKGGGALLRLSPAAVALGNRLASSGPARALSRVSGRAAAYLAQDLSDLLSGVGGQTAPEAFFELQAERELIHLEADNPGSHFYARHGAQTTLEQQEISALTGVRPDNYQQNFLSDSTRFYSHQDQLEAIQFAMKQFAADPTETTVNIQLSRLIGEGYKAGTGEYVVTNNVTVIFRNGKPWTAYPLIKVFK